MSVKSEKTAEPEGPRWKQKYYDHLDLLDKKTSDWQTLESILKKSVLRLSIAAEGQHRSMDRHLQDIRSMMKKQVNVIRLNNTLDDISSVLLKMEDGKAGKDKKIVTTLARLLENINFPASVTKQKQKLINKLTKASDKHSDNLIEEVQNLVSGSINLDAGNSHEESKQGFLSKLLSSSDNKKSIKDETVNDKSGISNTDNVINIDNDDLNQIKHNVQAKSDMSDLDASTHDINRAANEPSARDVLLHLMQQLTVPADLHEQFESLKHRIENESYVNDWKPLLKDVALLINTLRNRMQEEKHEFETFLQQITGRLQEMDSFLSIETTALTQAEQSGNTFDVVVNAQVQDIQDDMNSADDLDDLKDKVEKRLTVVSEHIKEYRIVEQQRYSSAQQNVENMQSRLIQMEHESGNLKKLMIATNKEAMFDVLTKIPNRLAYEKKAIEEIARCHRFDTPLSMAVWDVDLFKGVNDTYGHKVGDKVLRAVAQLLEERMRATDFIARYGGEEFVMFLPGASEDETLTITETLREKIAACKFNNEGEIIRITISCGISSYIDDDDHESLFERADKALYAAKEKGRNQCVTSTSLAN